MVAPHKNRLEKQQLIAIISKYEAIIDSRKADRKSISSKRKTWIKISSEFNGLPNVRPCSANQLKRFWSNLKARDLQTKKLSNKDIANRSENNSYLFEDPIDEDDGRFDDIGLDSCDSETNTVPGESMSSKLKQQNQHPNTAIDEQEKGVSRANGSSSVDSGKKFTRLKIIQNNSPYNCFFNLMIVVINAQLSKLEMSICHMREIHQLAVQREKLQVRLLERQLEEQTILHQFRLDNEKEIHHLRIKHEQELHLQRMRFDQDQRRIHDVHGYPMR